jgi:penicillin amidase
VRLATRIAGILTALIVAALLLLAASTFPARSGRQELPGLTAEVEITEDAHGVPRIRAKSEEDAAYALGYLHARDRLWQLEYQRRAAAGRLAEVLGEPALEADKFLRTIGMRRAAEAALSRQSEPLRRTVEAYVAGLNAYLATGRARPVEMRLLGVEPEPFTAVDALSMGYLISWDLGGSAGAEIRRARLEQKLGRERAAEMFPPPPERPTILEDGEWVMPAPTAAPAAAPPKTTRRASASPGLRVAPRLWAQLARAIRKVTVSEDRDGVGSNSWVLAGSRTTTGRPILANDPHLALRAPSTWYMASLEAPGFQVSGATLPGLPVVIIGRNARLAWGLTSLEPDVLDLFVETVAAEDPARYRHRGEWKTFETRREILRVRGGREVTLEVRSSVHGPIVTDIFSGAETLGAPVALCWTGLHPSNRSLETFYRMNRAGDSQAVLAAIAMHDVPPQNFVWATDGGQIGYAASGRIPIRPRHDGSVPVSGEGDDDWTGEIPRESLPRVVDPPRGWIVTANNRVVSSSYPFSFTADWPEPYRARRITDRIAARGRLSPEEIRDIQMDVVSYQAMDLLPLLRSTVPADPASKRALDRLQGWWELAFEDDSIPAAIYAAWYTEISKIAEDEVGPLARPARSRFLLEALSGESAWCDDVRTTETETCAQFRTRALSAAVEELSKRLGEDPENWRWGRLHAAHFEHVLSEVPVAGGLLSPKVARGGDGSTVNVGGYRRDGSFRMLEGPSYRQIVAFGATPELGFVHAPGQSGNVLDRRYRDLLPLWRDGGLLRPEDPVSKRLILVPKSAG